MEDPNSLALARAGRLSAKLDLYVKTCHDLEDTNVYLDYRLTKKNLKQVLCEGDKILCRYIQGVDSTYSRQKNSLRSAPLYYKGSIHFSAWTAVTPDEECSEFQLCVLVGLRRENWCYFFVFSR